MLAVKQYHGNRFRKQFLAQKRKQKPFRKQFLAQKHDRKPFRRQFLVQKHKQKLFRKQFRKTFACAKSLVMQRTSDEHLYKCGTNKSRLPLLSSQVMEAGIYAVAEFLVNSKTKIILVTITGGVDGESGPNIISFILI